MRPVLKSVVDSAVKNHIQVIAETKLVPVMEITAQTAIPTTDPNTTPISLTNDPVAVS